MKKELIIAATGIALLSGCETDKEQQKGIDNKLKELKQTPKTNAQPIMADCYAISIQPARIETIDPVTGLKTLNVKRG
jgi:protein involved in sex pheromone biosynthesis